MDLFQYKPLDLTEKSFRLLMLHPGSTGEISCDIFEASLDSEGIIPYEALSYAWGSIDLSASIIANGKTLRITNNLFTALTYLRDDHVSKVMWIDAVCIDQSNVAERGHQVGQMAGIYRGAEQVIVWLGPPTHATNLLLGCLKELHKSWARQKSRNNLDQAQEQWTKIRQNSGLDQAVLINLQRRGLVSLLEETWFTRIWVLQEVSNARAASIYSGRRSVQAYMLNIAAKLVGVVPNAGCQAVLDLLPNSFTQRSPRKDVLLTLLQKFQSSKASDPRDMVYALLAIASDVSQNDSGSLLSPDYFKTEEHLVQDLKIYLFLDARYCIFIPERTMESFLEALPGSIAAILQSVVVTGVTSHVLTLLERGQKFTVNKADIDAMWREEGLGTTEVLSNLAQIEHQNFHFSLEGVEASFQFFDLATAQSLVSRYGERIQINQHLATALLRRRDGRDQILMLLIEWDKPSIPLTQNGLTALVKLIDPASLQMLLKKQTKVYQITDKVLEEASRNRNEGKIIPILLDSVGDRTEFEMSGLLWLLRFFDKKKLMLLLVSNFSKISIAALGLPPDESVLWSTELVSGLGSLSNWKKIEYIRESTESQETLDVEAIRMEAEFINAIRDCQFEMARDSTVWRLLYNWSFRLLILYPGDDEIRCDIFQAVLEPDDIIPYEALSYAWGGIDRTESITANGKRLPVTERLFTALVHLRTQQARILWVDAICIDQDNFAERGHQVGQMAGIYRQAEQVLIWLGPGTLDTALLMEDLAILHEVSTQQRRRDDTDWARVRWTCLQLGYSDARKLSCQSGLQQLLQQAWFTRVWVIQEVSYARAASICCGSSSVPAHIFVIATELINVELDDQRQTLMDLMPSPSNKRHGSTRKKSLHTLLQKFRASQATDPRDMVYALLGIASDAQQDNGLLVPDYFKTEAMLIRDLESYLFFGRTTRQRRHHTHMRSFLKALPKLTNSTFQGLISAGNLDSIQKLLGRGQSYETTAIDIWNIESTKLIEDPNKKFCDLLDLSAPNFTISSAGIIATLDWCDDKTVSEIIRYYVDRMEISAEVADSIRARNDASPVIDYVTKNRLEIKPASKAFHRLLTLVDPLQISRFFFLPPRRECCIDRGFVEALQMIGTRGKDNLVSILNNWEPGAVHIEADGLLSILAFYDAEIVALLGRQRIASIELVWVDMKLTVQIAKKLAYEYMVLSQDVLPIIRERLQFRGSVVLSVIERGNNRIESNSIEWEEFP
ncbi:HET domain-containing protein [Colletotrichum scovillei]|uniref:HET domain-containing protein n=1 Tax=Colletotrichum scovillei TaxID=1209932 RepID=A0A9P7RAI3_9PEZI|nr:HET domain-containing protein [Colletotrichum scovillei]KAG7079964.1 HET domain-containing protein [Colletotrichum scovillei]